MTKQIISAYGLSCSYFLTDCRHHMYRDAEEGNRSGTEFEGATQIPGRANSTGPVECEGTWSK